MAASYIQEGSDIPRMEAVFIGRQPILDREGKLYGYELLHRRPGADRVIDSDGDRMTSEVLLNAVLEVGLPEIANGHRAFINVTGNILTGRPLDTFPSARIVLEVLEDVRVDVALVERLRTLRSRHFEIALDDFVCSPERQCLVGIADIIKLDVLALDETELERHVQILKRGRVKLLAEKVESQATYARLKSMGFDLFQGYYFARPETYQGHRILPNKLILMDLLVRVNDPNISSDALSAIIRGDVALSVTVLRWANAPLHGLRQPATTVERAIIVLGLQTIRNWVSLLALARMGTTTTELLTLLLVRARTCELLATSARRPDAAGYFTVGLLSGLDVILRVDMTIALARVPLSAEQRSALLMRSGDHGDALNTVVALETGDLAAAHFAALGDDRIADCYLAALAWGDSLNIGLAA